MRFPLALTVMAAMMLASGCLDLEMDLAAGAERCPWKGTHGTTNTDFKVCDHEFRSANRSAQISLLRVGDPPPDWERPLQWPDFSVLTNRSVSVRHESGPSVVTNQDVETRLAGFPQQMTEGERILICATPALPSLSLFLYTGTGRDGASGGRGELRFSGIPSCPDP